MKTVLNQLTRLSERDLRQLSEAVHAELRQRLAALAQKADGKPSLNLLREDAEDDVPVTLPARIGAQGGNPGPRRAA